MLADAAEGVDMNRLRVVDYRVITIRYALLDSTCSLSCGYCFPLNSKCATHDEGDAP